jgi:hypothetical protein
MKCNKKTGLKSSWIVDAGESRNGLGLEKPVYTQNI